MPVAFVKSAISGARLLVTSDQSKLTTCSPLAVGRLPQEPSRPLARAAPLAVLTTRRKVRRLRGLGCVAAPMISAPVRSMRGSIEGLPSLFLGYSLCCATQEA